MNRIIKTVKELKEILSEMNEEAEIKIITYNKKKTDYQFKLINFFHNEEEFDHENCRGYFLETVDDKEPNRNSD